MLEMPDTFPDWPELAAGEVWLVGAGPGDPRLLTLMAVHALRSADCILHDALIDPRVLALARPGTIVLATGKRGGRPSSQQHDITAAMIEHAKSGRRVVRLKGGDPFVFGRGAEEAEALAGAGIPFRVVPGLTAGLAGPALAGIPATSRDTNHAVILATGHHAADAGAIAAWTALARTGQPIVLYMAMSNLADIMLALQTGGLSPDLPVAVIRSATLEGEHVLETTVAAAAEAARTAGIGSPALVIIGDIVGIRARLAPMMRAL